MWRSKWGVEAVQLTERHGSSGIAKQLSKRTAVTHPLRDPRSCSETNSKIFFFRDLTPACDDCDARIRERADCEHFASMYARRCQNPLSYLALADRFSHEVRRRRTGRFSNGIA